MSETGKRRNKSRKKERQETRLALFSVLVLLLAGFTILLVSVLTDTAGASAETLSVDGSAVSCPSAPLKP